MTVLSYVMTVSRNGQVSIPAATRARWDTRKVIVVDLGDKIVLRPTADDAIKTLRGRYRDVLPPTDALRREARREDRDR